MSSSCEAGKVDGVGLCKARWQASMAWPGTPISSLLNRLKASDAFKAEFLAVGKVVAGKKPNKVTPTEAMHLSASGYQVERYYDLLTKQEFSDHFKMSTKAAGIKTQVLQDERGEFRPFVLLQPRFPGPGTPSRLRIFSDLRLSVDKTILTAPNVIREGQGESVKDV